MGGHILDIMHDYSAQAVQKVFDGFGLPVPVEGEYRQRSADAGPLVLVTRYGFVVRVVPEREPDIENAHCIRRLFSRAAGNYRFVVDPGYKLQSLDTDTCQKIRSTIEKNTGFSSEMHTRTISPGFPRIPITWLL